MPVIRLLAACALLLCVTGCGTALPGTAVPNETAAEEAAEPLTAKAALGDFATIDYCSLTDANAVPQRLGSVAVLPRGAYDECRLSVQKDGVDTEVRLGSLQEEDHLTNSEYTLDGRVLPRGLRVYRGTETGGKVLRCVLYLRFADRILLTIDTWTREPGGDRCAVADAVLAIAVDRAAAKRVRHHDVGARTLFRTDACDMLSVEVVRARTGLPDLLASRSLTRHVCRWYHAYPGDVAVDLYLGPAESTWTGDTVEETLAGHRTLVTASFVGRDGVAVCAVETSIVAVPRPAVNESAVLWVELPRPATDACRPARELASEVWAKLPW
ncbi:MAG TPA: hypothetical protein VFV67_05300 [Actinophytocola sp.]|uniref:hypothetical protein n=1 Tax=Actinophytocola sp. TaxID=1872138 RepID=UPI002DB8C6D8|nr:hypothetical protein [Actinophytocola sp.]HEU5470049.1 hypothetical protein [Actinophytocola sp.]